MSLEPLKKELEAIEQELEAAMLDLSATTERVDALLSDFSSVPRRVPAATPVEQSDPSASSEPDDGDE